MSGYEAFGYGGYRSVSDGVSAAPPPPPPPPPPPAGGIPMPPIYGPLRGILNVAPPGIPADQQPPRQTVRLREATNRVALSVGPGGESVVPFSLFTQMLLRMERLEKENESLTRIVFELNDLIEQERGTAQQVVCMHSPHPIYLDNNASTNVDPAVFAVMAEWLDGTRWGNPHAGHFMGAAARAAMDKARSQVKAVFGLGSDWTCLFTSSASESNNLAVKGVVFNVLRKQKEPVTILSTQVEHGSIDSGLQWLVDLFGSDRVRVVRFPVNEHAIIDLAAAEQLLRNTSKIALVSCIHTVAETGAVQPVSELASLVRRLHPTAIFHSDAAQSVGKLAKDELESLSSGDMITVAAHKFHGPKGVGALLVRLSVLDLIDPLIHGAGQEMGKRGGSENVAFIVGLGQASEIAMNTTFPTGVAQELWKTISSALTQVGIDHRLNSTAPVSSPATINFSVAGLNGPAVVASAGNAPNSPICFSAGSACHSRGCPVPSKVLAAMGLDVKYSASGLRLSIDKHMTLDAARSAGEMVAKYLIGVI